MRGPLYQIHAFMSKDQPITTSHCYPSRRVPIFGHGGEPKTVPHEEVILHDNLAPGPSSYLFHQDGFGLSAESLLLPVVTPPALSEFGLLGLLVLRHAELLVRVALWVRTEGPPGLRNVHLKMQGSKHEENVMQKGDKYSKNGFSPGRI